MTERKRGESGDDKGGRNDGGLLVQAVLPEKCGTVRRKIVLGAVPGILLFCLYSGFVLHCLPLQAATEERIRVDYLFQGKIDTVWGRRVGETTWIFNEGAAKKISAATLDWPPYISMSMCSQGWVQQLTAALLASQGYELTTTFLPWARAVELVEGGMLDMLYPEYFIEPEHPSDVIGGTARLDHLALSGQFPGGTVAFVKRAGEADRFRGNLHNLRGESIGVVRRYQNTPEFDNLMSKGFFRISEATDDLMNVRKLLAGRVDLIVGDPTVIRYRIAEAEIDPGEKAKILESIEAVEPELRYNHLYYAFSKKAGGWQTKLEEVNQALREFSRSGEIGRLIAATDATCRNSGDSAPDRQKNGTIGPDGLSSPSGESKEAGGDDGR